VSRDAELSTEDLANSGAGQEGTFAASDERPGATPGEYAGATQMQVGGAPPGERDGGMAPAPAAGVGGADMALLDPVDGERFRQRWSDVQARFVDDPRDAVQTADGLVVELMQALARGFSDHKARLESAWQTGGDPDTEELRQALQRYRSFFNRLLST
jgi:hypothetical protein